MQHDREATQSYLRTGDYVFIVNEDRAAQTFGYVSGEGFLNKDVLFKATDKDDVTVGGRMYDCLFKVVPKLQYSAQREYTKSLARAGRSRSTADLRTDSFKAMGTSTVQQVESLQESERIERLMNEEIEENESGLYVLYGQAVQLLHVRSNTYLTMHNRKLANLEKDCSLVYLKADGSAGAQFTITPSYKLRAEGQEVFIDDEVFLAHRKSRSYLRVSDGSVAQNTDDREVNAAAISPEHQPSKFRFVKFANYDAQIAELAYPPVHCGECIKLYQTESDSFLSASLVNDSIFLRSNGQDFPNAMSYWIVESEGIKEGGPAAWNKHFRLRNLVTNSYLTFNGEDRLLTKGNNLTSGTALMFQSTTSLEDDHINYSDTARIYNPDQGLTLHNAGYHDNADEGGIQLVGSHEIFFEDAFHFQRVSNEEMRDALLVLSAKENVAHYLSLLGNAPIPAATAKRVIGVLSELIYFATKTSRRVAPLDVSGLPKPGPQQMLKDLGVLDLLGESLSRPLKSGSIPLDQLQEKRPRIHEVLRYTYKTIIRAISGNRENENYFSKWIGVVMEQLGHDLMAEDCLTTLVSDNKELLEDYINADSISYLIEKMKGDPDEKDLGILEALCSCLGEPIESNQILVAESLLLDGDKPSEQVWHTLFVNAELRDNEIYVASSAVQSGQPMKLSDMVKLAAMEERIADTLKFFVAQLHLFSEMALGRNYVVIKLLQDRLSYQLLLRGLRDQWLPLEVREAFGELMITLHLDQGGNKAIKRPNYVKLWNEVDFVTLDSAPGQEQFQGLKDFAVSYLEEVGGIQVSEWKERNNLTESVLKMVKLMIEFAFFSTKEELSLLAKPMVRILDGSSDVYTATAELEKKHQNVTLDSREDARLSMVSFHGGDDDGHGEVSRYDLDEKNLIIMKCKRAICNILSDIFDIRLDIILAELVSGFKRSTRYQMTEGSSSDLAPQSFKKNDFEILTAALESSSSAMLDMQALSQQDLSQICFDLILYDFAPLTFSAVEVLLKKCLLRGRALFEAARLQVFARQELVEVYHRAKSSLALVTELEETNELWIGTGSESSKIDSIREVYHELAGYCVTEEDGKKFARVDYQILLTNMGAHDVALNTLKQLTTTSDTRVLRMHREVFSNAFLMLQRLCLDNSENQTSFASHINFLLRCDSDEAREAGLDYANAIMDTLFAIFRNNPSLCIKADEDFVRQIGVLIRRKPESKYLELLSLLCEPTPGNPYPDNQKAVLKELFAIKQEHPECFLLFDGEEGNRKRLVLMKEHRMPAELSYHVSLLKALVACCSGAMYMAEARCQLALPLPELRRGLAETSTTLPVKEALLKFCLEVFLLTEATVVNLVVDPDLLAIISRVTTDLKVIQSSREAPSSEKTQFVVSIIVPMLACYMEHHYDEDVVESNDTAKQIIALWVQGVLAVLKKVIHTAQSTAVLTERERTSVTECFDIISKFYRPPIIIKQKQEREIDALKQSLETIMLQQDRLARGPPKVERAPQALSFMEFVSELPDNEAIGVVLSEDTYHLVTDILESTKSDPNKIISKLIHEVETHFSEDERDSINMNSDILTLLVQLMANPPATKSGFTIDGSVQTEAADLAVKLISDNTPPDVLAKALHLNSELLQCSWSGKCQDIMLEVVQENGVSDMFVNIRNCLEKTVSSLKTIKSERRKKTILIESGGNPAELKETKSLGDYMISEYLRFMQLLCENHHNEWQLYLANQSESTAKVNLVVETSNFLVAFQKFIAKDIDVLDSEMLIAIQCMDTLAEFVQGPCEPNQTSLINTGIVEIVQKFLRNSYRCDQKLLRELRTKGVMLLNSVLEGRLPGSNPATFERIFSALDVKLMRNRIVSIHELHENPLAEEEKQEEVDDNVGEDDEWIKSFVDKRMKKFKGAFDVDSLMGLMNRREVSDDVREEAFQILILLRQLKIHDRKNKVIIDPTKLTDPKLRFEDGWLDKYSAAYRYFTQFVGSIEIKREVDDEEIVEKVFFRIPEMALSLTEPTKVDLLYRLDRSDPAQKVSDFQDKAPGLIAEMRHQYNLRSNRVVQTLAEYLDVFKNLSFLLVLAINIYNMFAYSKANGNSEPHREVFDALAIAQLFFASNIWIFYLLNYGPIISAKGWQKRFKASKQQSAALEMMMSKNWFMFLYRHYQRLKKTLWWIDDVRRLIIDGDVSVHENNKYNPVIPLAYYLISLFYILRDHQFLFYSIYVSMSVVAINIHPAFFAFHLLELIIRNETLKNVVRAVTHNAASLLMTAILGVILIWIYANIGYFYFSVEYEGADCETLLLCFTTTFYEGLRNGGGMADYLEPTRPEFDDDYTFRYIYDMAFFFTVIIILLNIIFGIIIDTFADLRGAKKDKEEDMANVCTMCGLERGVFDRQAQGFQYHIHADHNMWQYLYFIAYLEDKDPNTYNGVESYVAEQVESGYEDWYPLHKALCLERSEDDEISQLTTMTKAVQRDASNTREMVEELQEEIETLKGYFGHNAGGESGVSEIFASSGEKEKKKGRMKSIFGRKKK